MSKIKRVVKSVAKLVNDVVPNEIKPIVQAGLAMIPGVGPAISAAYTAVDAYGGGASLGKSLGAGVKSFAISQVAGAASKALGLSSTGNDLTDALGMTENDGIMGLGSGTASGAATTGTTAAASQVSTSGLSDADKTFLASAQASANKVPASVAAGSLTESSGSLFTFENGLKAAGVAGAALTAGSLLTGSKSPTMPSSNSGNINDEAALAAEEENKRKRRDANSNIYTSPLGLVNPGQSAASVLLG